MLKRFLIVSGILSAIAFLFPIVGAGIDARSKTMPDPMDDAQTAMQSTYRNMGDLPRLMAPTIRDGRTYRITVECSGYAEEVDATYFEQIQQACFQSGLDNLPKNHALSVRVSAVRDGLSTMVTAFEPTSIDFLDPFLGRVKQEGFDSIRIDFPRHTMEIRCLSDVCRSRFADIWEERKNIEADLRATAPTGPDGLKWQVRF